MIVLKFIGIMALCILLFIGGHLFAFWLATKDMTDEEKDSLLKYIDKNGFFSDSDL